MNTDALHKQKIFWIIILLPILIGITLYIPMFLEYDFSFTVDGIMSFYEMSKFQMYVMLLSIPLGALVARIHATIQKEADLTYKKNEALINQDEKYIAKIEGQISIIKEELTLVSIDESGTQRIVPNNKNINWIKAAKTLIRIFENRAELEFTKSIALFDEQIENLHFYLYRNLTWKEKPLPVHFFAGGENWQKDFSSFEELKTGDSAKDLAQLEDYILRKKGNQLLSFRSNITELSPRFNNNSISKIAITCIYDFINQFVETLNDDLDSKFDFINKIKNHPDLIDWPQWDTSNDTWQAHEMKNSEGAAKYIYITSRKK